MVLGGGCWSGKWEGKCAWVQLIVTIMKPLVKTATCQETTNAKEQKINIALTQIVPSKMCDYLFVKGYKGSFYFYETIKRLWRLLPFSRARTSYTLLSYENLIRGGKQIWICTRSGKTKTRPEAGNQ